MGGEGRRQGTESSCCRSSRADFGTRWIPCVREGMCNLCTSHSNRWKSSWCRSVGMLRVSPTRRSSTSRRSRRWSLHVEVGSACFDREELELLVPPNSRVRQRPPAVGSTDPYSVFQIVHILMSFWCNFRSCQSGVRPTPIPTGPNHESKFGVALGPHIRSRTRGTRRWPSRTWGQHFEVSPAATFRPWSTGDCYRPLRRIPATRLSYKAERHWPPTSERWASRRRRYPRRRFRLPVPSNGPSRF